MSNKSYKSTISYWIFWLVVYFDIACCASVQGKNSLDENRSLPKAKGTIKTIECPEDGDVIDCVDFWKQPAFDNPLIKKIQMMEPRRSFPEAFETRNDSRLPPIFQKWNKYGECPKGTIPIRRTPEINSSIYHRKVPGVDGYEHEYAIVQYRRGRYYGTRALLNLWKPFVEENTREFSLAQIWLKSNVANYHRLNTIEAGWMVSPNMYGDNLPRIFIYWTANGYVDSGCYNLVCSGFVQSHPTFSFGCSQDYTSIYGGTQYELKLEIERDQLTGNWWLYVNNLQIGFWPHGIFTTLSRGAEEVDWGGEIINDKVGDQHTFTQMGSGHFPEEGVYHAAYFREIELKDAHNNWNDANLNLLTPFMDQPNCYRAQLGVPGTASRSYFLYGGPGGIGCDGH